MRVELTCCLFLVELVPPTPTQRPRSIASSSKPNASSTNSSSRPARKRPCRTSRTEPVSSNHASNSKTTGTGNGTSLKGSSSLPLNSPRGSVKLDTLLQRFELLSTPLGPSRASTSTSTSTITSTRSAPAPSAILRDQRETNCQLFGNGELDNTSSPVTRSTTSLKQNHPGQANKHAELGLEDATVSPLLSRGTTRPHGLGVRPNQPQIRSGMKPIPKTTGQKPFKPPFLIPPTRSSPRHLRQATTIPPSPLRAAALPVPSHRSINIDQQPQAQARSNKPTPTPTVDETPCRGKVRKHNANVDIGEDDPAGDSSFDSFDGLFETGGPELEALLKTVDGSQ